MKKKSKTSVGRTIVGGVLLFLGFEHMVVAIINIIFLFRFDIMSLIIGPLLCILGFNILIGTGKLKLPTLKQTGEKAARPLKPVKKRPRHPAEEESWREFVPKTAEDVSAGFSFEPHHHQHIQITGISREKRLEQLDTLYQAGMYTKEQYQDEKNRILAGK